MLIRRHTPGGVIYEVDFSALSSVPDLGTDTTVTIGGRTWHVTQNISTNKAQIVNGEGLRIYGCTALQMHDSVTVGLDLGQFGETITDCELWARVSYSSLISTWVVWTNGGMTVDHLPSVARTTDAETFRNPYMIWYLDNGTPRMSVYENRISGSSTLVASTTDSEALPAVSTEMVWMYSIQGQQYRTYYHGPTGLGAGWPSRNTLTSLSHTTSARHKIAWPGALFGPQFFFNRDNTAYMTVHQMRIVRL